MNNELVNEFFINHFKKKTNWYKSNKYTVFEPKLLNSQSLSIESELETITFIQKKSNQYLKILVLTITLVAIYFIFDFFGYPLSFNIIKYPILIIFGLTMTALYSTKENIDKLILDKQYLKYNTETILWSDISTIRIVSAKYYTFLSNPYDLTRQLFVFMKNGRVLIRDIKEIPIAKLFSTQKEEELLGHYIYFYLSKV